MISVITMANNKLLLLKYDISEPVIVKKKERKKNKKAIKRIKQKRKRKKSTRYCNTRTQIYRVVSPKQGILDFLNNFALVFFENNFVIDISPPILYLAKFLFLSYWSKFCRPITLQNSLKCNISRKKWAMKFIFDMQIKHENLSKACPCMLQAPKIGHLQYLFSISRKT